MKQQTTHEEQLQFLRKIEGQVAGIQRMIKESGRLLDPKIVNAFLQIPYSQWDRIERQVIERSIYIAGEGP